MWLAEEDDAVMRDAEDAQEMEEDAGDEDDEISMTDGSAHETGAS